MAFRSEREGEKGKNLGNEASKKNFFSKKETNDLFIQRQVILFYKSMDDEITENIHVFVEGTIPN